MTPKILIIDHTPERRKKLVSVLRDRYVVVDKERDDSVDAESKYVFAVVHVNNWSAANGWPNFKKKLEDLGIPYIAISAGGKEQVLFLKRGDEYSEVQWSEAIHKFIEKKIDTSGFLKLMYKKDVGELIEELSVICVMKNDSPHLADVVQSRIDWIYKKKNENVKGSAWVETIEEQAKMPKLVERLLQLLELTAKVKSNESKQELCDLLFGLSGRYL